MPRINKKLVDSLEKREKDFIVWDDVIMGFGIKVTPSGRKCYFFKYLGEGGKQHKPSIGVHG